MVFLFQTKHLQAATFAKVAPEELDAQERRLIMEGSLGYCENHQNLYRKTTQETLEQEGCVQGLLECPVSLLVCKCDDPNCQAQPKHKDVGPCKEWK